ncbi:MAG: glycosyltransferase family 39 protein [Nitrospinae bacterium]|nr:glycosyltransferase family 39 protein [Nitrospinota bacterium]
MVEDEAITFNRYGLLPWKEILFYYPDTNQHTLFSLLSNLCMRLLGENEIFFRLPSFLAGVFSVPLLYVAGKTLSISNKASFIGACLLAVSSTHLNYSQQGRGYALTVFFALTVILATTKLLENKGTPLWGGILIASGFCMALALPSNGVFLAASGIYCFAAKSLDAIENRRFPDKNFISISIAFGVLLLLVGVYFYLIYPGLKTAVKNYNYTPIDAAFFSQTALFLTAPWGYWAYSLVGIGLLDLKSKKEISLISSLLGIPIIVMLALGIGGFSRTYIYLLPFVLLLAAQGAAKTLDLLNNVSSIPRYVLSALLALGMTFAPADNLIKRSTSPFPPGAATISEARQVFSYVQKEIPSGHFIVLWLPSETSVLNRYFAARLRQSMYNFAAGEKPDKIVLISHLDAPPQNFSIGGYYANSSFNLPSDSLKLIKEIGNMRIHELDKNISRFIPPSYNADYLAPVEIPESPVLAKKIEKKDKALGETALKFEKNTSQNLALTSSAIKSVDIKKEGACLLTIYLRKYGQKSNALLADYNPEQWPPKSIYINPYFGEFSAPGFDFNWQIVITISPMAAGRHNLVEVFDLIDQTSYFDGFQTFILS